MTTFGSKWSTGSIFDRELTRQSGIFKLLEPGDEIMANKGFLTEKLLEDVAAKTIISSFQVPSPVQQRGNWENPGHSHTPYSSWTSNYVDNGHQMNNVSIQFDNNRCPLCLTSSFGSQDEPRQSHIELNILYQMVRDEYVYSYTPNG